MGETVSWRMLRRGLLRSKCRAVLIIVAAACGVSAFGAVWLQSSMQSGTILFRRQERRSGLECSVDVYVVDHSPKANAVFIHVGWSRYRFNTECQLRSTKIESPLDRYDPAAKRYFDRANHFRWPRMIFDAKFMSSRISYSYWEIPPSMPGAPGKPWQESHNAIALVVHAALLWCVALCLLLVLLGWWFSCRNRPQRGFPVDGQTEGAN